MTTTRYVEALKPFSDALDGILGEVDALDDQSIWDNDACQMIKVGDLRRARAVIEQMELDDEQHECFEDTLP